MQIDLRWGDCLALMEDIQEASVDLVLCDLPYGTTACKWDSVIPFEPLWAHYRRIAHTVILTASQPFTSTLACSNLDWLKYSLVWEKNRTGGFWDAKFRPLKSHEDVLIFSCRGCSNGSKVAMTYNPQGTRETDKKWSTKPVSGNSRTGSTRVQMREVEGYPRSVLSFESETKPVHPTQKPVALMEYLIRTYTNPGMTVLDNCMGSGTTGVACVNTGRNFIGIEKDSAYFHIAQQRIENSRAESFRFDDAISAD